MHYALGVLFLVPFVAYALKSRWKLFAIVGEVVMCFVIGVALGPWIRSVGESQSLTSITEVSIALALPLMLVSTDFKTWFKSAPTILKSFALGIFSLLCVSIALPFFFKQHLEQVPEISGMLVGVYTGGTVNLSAVGKALNVGEELFLLVNGMDVLVGTSYFLFLMSVGAKFWGLILKVKPVEIKGDFHQESTMTPLSFETDERIESLKKIFLWLVFDLLVVAISFGLTKLLLGKIHVITFILFITIFSLACSFKKSMREFPGSYQVGHYFLLIFCVSIGAMSDVEKMVNNINHLFFYTLATVYGTVLLHALLAKIFKIDRDSYIITSCAGIFGPPFVPAVASTLKNHQLVVSGITSGLVGYSIGNFMGIGVCYLVRYIYY